MYCIKKKDDYLLVEFKADLDYSGLKTVIHHETMLKEYPLMNDIWLIGKHHVMISISDLETMVQDFRCHCPRDSNHRKTAIVADLGLTEAILQLWVKTAGNRVPFELKIFHTLQEAEAWLSVVTSRVA